MPKYAVAVGKKVGIYDTYDECKSQVLNYPNAKYKKFETMAAAEEFIRLHSNQPNQLKLSTFTPAMPENVNTPELIMVNSNSRSLSLNSLMQKLNSLDEKFTRHMNETSNALEKLNTRLFVVENQLASSSASVSLEDPPAKKIKMEEISQLGLTKNNDGIVTVFTDGACTNNGKKGAKAGIGVWFNHDHPLNVSAPVVGPPTNNNAEIQAATVAIKQAHKAGVRRLLVNTDSKFLISCITEWISKWKKNGWQLSTGGPVKNKDEIVKLDAAIQRMDFVKWNYIPGHSGIEGNEKADQLARSGAALYNPKITYSSSYEDLIY